MVEPENALPEPMVSPEIDLRNFGYMPLDVLRLRDSSFAAESTGEEFKAAVLLWCVSWHQVPAGSLPDNDRALSRYSGLDSSEWKLLRKAALRGFVKCSDGRLYHALIAEKVKESWAAKQAQKQRTLKANEKRQELAFQRNIGRDEERDNQRNVERDVTRDVDVTLENNQRDGERNDRRNVHQGNGREGKGEDMGGGASKKQPEPPPPGRKRPPKESSPDSLAGVRPAGTRIDPDWSLTPELKVLGERARSEFGLPPVNLELAAANFHDHYVNELGYKGFKTDWTVAWKNWCRKEYTNGASAPPKERGLAYLAPGEVD